MRTFKRPSSAAGLLVVFLLLILIFTLGHAGIAMGGWWGPLTLVFWLIALAMLMGGLCGHAGHGHHIEAPGVPPIPAQIQTADVFAAETQHRAGGAAVAVGRLLVPAESAIDRLLDRFRGSGWTPLLTSAENGADTLLLIPADLDQPRSVVDRRWLHALLFVATIATTTWAGALHQGVNLLKEPGRFTVGLPYALALMLILGAHEMGHYLLARRHGMSVSLPYFIPVPFGLGTFGAFISLRSPARSRAALFDMAVAGPLAGVVFAIPALIIGLPLSRVVESPAAASLVGMHGGTSLGSSFLLASLARLTLGDGLEGHTLLLHPLAFAGWLGLIVTSLNLLPIGQLDGGHIADAMFGRRGGAMVGAAAMFALFILGLFVWSGLLFWAFVVYFMAGRKGLPPLNDITPLGPARQALGWCALALLVAIIVPVPHAFLESMGVRCPYL